jgi:hypothetical protein
VGAEVFEHRVPFLCREVDVLLSLVGRDAAQQPILEQVGCGKLKAAIIERFEQQKRVI